MKTGASVSVSCTRLDADGAGVGTVDGVEVHVACALPGEDVTATVSHVSPHRPHAWAALDAIGRASPARVEPACPAFGACGGCVLQHLAYDAQLAWKTQQVRDALAAHAVIPETPVEACRPAPRPLAWRNQAKLVAGRGDDGALVLGAFAPRSHRLVDLAGCRVVEPPLDEVAATLRALAARHGVEPFDEVRRTGLLRYVLLRVTGRGEVLATLVTARGEFPDGGDLARALRAAHPEVAGVVQNVNPSRGNALLGDEEATLDGVPFVVDEVAGVPLRLSSRAFFQANRAAAGRLYANVVAAVAPTAGERAVDAYAGVGGMALLLARHAREVVALEQVGAAVADGRASAVLAAADNLRFMEGDTAASLAALGAVDVVVLDPPRRGCEPAALDAVIAARPRVVGYVSCSPATLSRDLARLGTLGHRVRLVQPYDMMPGTPHVEVFALVEPGAAA